MGVSEMGRSFYIQTKETEDQTMATKKTAVIPEEEILAAATDENINEHALHQTETEPEPDRVLSAEGAPGDADLIDICQTDSRSANPEGMPIEDAARNTPEAPVSQTGSDTELLGEFPAGSDELTAPEAPASQTDSDLDEKKPEESPPARRTRKPRAKKSESDTAAAEPPEDASDGVESPEKKPRRRAAARPASPVVSIDERPSVETEADKARNDLLDLVESLKTKRILTGTIQGIERPADHPSRSLAVIYHGDIKVIIPAEEAVEPPEDFRGRLPEDVLHYMVTKRLGAEVDYIIKGIDAKAGVAVGSRLEAMSAKRRAYYFGTDRDGNNLLYEGICAEARVVSVIRAGIFVDLFGLEVYIPLRELSYQRMLDAQDSFQPGQRILVKILSIDRSDRTRIRVSASIKQAGENPYEKALRRYSVGNRYVGNAGLQPITVRKGTATSNAIYYNVLSGDQNQIVFHVSAETQLGENIYIVGNIPELGNWNPDNCTESMLNPNYPEWFLPVSVPSGTTIEFKFIKKDALGNITWESGSNRTVTSSSNPCGVVDTEVYTWRN